MNKEQFDKWWKRIYNKAKPLNEPLKIIIEQRRQVVRDYNQKKREELKNKPTKHINIRTKAKEEKYNGINER